MNKVMHQSITKISALTFILCASLPLLAQSEIHEAHVHGVSELTIAVDDKQIEVHLNSPTGNLMGFEGEPKTKAQHQAIKRTKALLADYNKLFSLSGASCIVAKSSVDIPDLAPAEHDHHHHGHHDHGHSHDHIEKQKHTNIKAMYLYRCKSTSGLSGIDVNLFELFPDTKEINTQWINTNKQGSAKLNKRNKTVKF